MWCGWKRLSPKCVCVRGRVCVCVCVYYCVILECVLLLVNVVLHSSPLLTLFSFERDGACIPTKKVSEKPDKNERAHTLVVPRRKTGKHGTGV